MAGTMKILFFLTHVSIINSNLSFFNFQFVSETMRFFSYFLTTVTNLKHLFSKGSNVYTKCHFDFYWVKSCYGEILQLHTCKHNFI